MNLDKYRATIGIERLKSFGYGKEDITEDYLLQMYELNLKTSQSLYPALSMVEIHLRNAIDTMMQTIFSVTWLENEIEKQNLLFDFDHNKLIQAYNTLQSKYKLEDITHGKLISELTFGFWVNLCSKKYNPKIWTKKGAFRGVFIDYPQDKQEKIHEISEKLNKIKKLRNRIFHYEPILHKKDKFGVLYNNICDIMSYLPKDNSGLFERTNNFPHEVMKMLYKMMK